MRGLKTGRTDAGRFGSADARGVALAVAGSIALGLLPVLVSTGVGPQFVAMLLALTSFVVLAVYADVRRRGDLLSPLALSGAFYLLAYVAGSVFYWFNPRLGQEVPFVLPFGHEALMATVGLATLGWLGLAGGYFVRPFAFLGIKPLKLDASREVRLRSLIIFYVVGWIARLADVAAGQYFHGGKDFESTSGSTTSQLLHVVSILPAVVVAYVGISALLTRDRRLLTLYWVGLALDVAFYLPSGGRGQVASVVFLALSVLYYVRHRVPLKALVTAAALLIFVVFPIIHLYRGSGGQEGFTRTPVANLKRSTAEYTGNGAGATIFYGLGATFSRFSQVLIPASLVEQDGNTFSVEPGSTLIWAASNFIPGAVWQNKPKVGNFAAESSYAMGLTSERTTSIATTQIGEMFLNFGVIGVAVGMFFVGAVYRELSEWLRERRRRPMVLALYASMAYGLLGTGESIVAVGLVGSIRTLLALAFFVWITSRFLDTRASVGPLRSDRAGRLIGAVSLPTSYRA